MLDLAWRQSIISLAGYACLAKCGLIFRRGNYMFVLLKHFPPSKIKPYHYEDFWRYIEMPPLNKCYKLLCFCSDLSEVFEAIKKDIVGRETIDS